MQKIITSVLTLVFMFSFIGCANPDKKQNNNSSDSTLTTSTTDTNDYESSLSYAAWTSESSIFTECLNLNKMSINGEIHCPIFKLNTKKEFDDFKTKYGDVLYMNSRYDDVLSFKDATAKYNDEFFKEQTLFVIYVTANSSSYRYEVDSIYCDGNSFDVHVKQANNPEAVTMDMAGWLITVAVKDDTVKNCTSFDADLNNPYGYP